MRFSHWSGIALSSVAIGLLVASCGPSKVAQCNKLSEVVNKAATEAQQLGKSSSNRLDDLNKAADSLDGYATELEAVKISDKKLQDFQARFVKMYRDTGKASRALVEAAKRRDRDAGQKALQELQQATGQESNLVRDINDYCRS
ncbi:MAG: hypothetical protein NZ772_00600 [Cyanobacteria bacterium]|nr:hypothetical protein [Cyanobacteriota bacterium]MDW8199871.1 hypothetical protein [Cyanobacteriota bacterium SKYGB_h_bin112]